MASEQEKERALGESTGAIMAFRMETATATNAMTHFTSEYNSISVVAAFSDFGSALKSLTSEIVVSAEATKKSEEAKAREQNRVDDSISAQSIAKSDLIKMVVNSVSGAMKERLTAQYGAEGRAAATIASSTISGAVAGTALLGPGVGTAIGSAIGLLTGAIEASTESFKEANEAFKEARNEILSQVEAKNTAYLQTGQELSMVEDRYIQHFANANGNDVDRAERIYKSINDYSLITPFSVEDVLPAAEVLDSWNFSAGGMGRGAAIVTAVGKGLEYSEEQVAQLANAIGSVYSSDHLNLEHLDAFKELGFDAYSYFVEFYESEEAFLQRIEEGIFGSTASDLLLQGLEAQNKDVLELYENSAEGKQNRILGYQNENQRAMGNSYYDAMDSTYDQQIGFYSKNYEGLNDAYGFLGERQAERDTAYAMINDQILLAFFDGAEEHFNELGKTLEILYGEDAQAQLDRIRDIYDKELANMDPKDENYALVLEAALQTAQASEIAIANGSDAMQEFLDMQDLFIKNFTDFFGDDERFYNAGERLSKALLKGLESKSGFTQVDLFHKGGYNDFSGISEIYDNNAWGLPYVPYDNYPTRLHEGERVLTAAEARAYRSASPAVTVTGNSFTVREEADVYKIAQAIASELARAQQVS